MSHNLRLASFLSVFFHLFIFAAGHVLLNDVSGHLNDMKSWSELFESASNPDTQEKLKNEINQLKTFLDQRTKSQDNLKGSKVSSSPDFSLLDSFIPPLMDCNHLPGLSISIVLGGESVYTKGFGLANAEGDKADEDTVFGIGSCSKAFTSLLATILVEQGSIASGGLISDILPGHRFSASLDGSSVLTLKDLLSHRTGVPRHDLAMFTQNLTRTQYVYNSRYFEPYTSIRSAFLYNNLMVATAGYALGLHHPSGSWERLVQEKIFDPLNMTRTFPSFAQAQNIPNRASTAFWNGSAFLPSHWEANFAIDPIAPAGSINSNAVDMAKWMNVHLMNSPVLIASNLSVWSTHQPANIMPAYPESQMPSLIHDILVGDNYGLGWQLGTYRGVKRVFHNGDAMGMHAMVSLIPSIGFGISVMTNGDNVGSFWRDTLVSYATDIALGLNPLLHNASEACQFPCQYWPSYTQCTAHGPKLTETSNFPVESDVPKDVEITAQSPFPLADYLGIYQNSGYGPLSIIIPPSSPNNIYGVYGTSNVYGAKLSGYLTYSGSGESFYFSGAPSYSISFSRNTAGTVIKATLRYADDVVYNIPFTNSAFNLASDSSSCSLPITANTQYLQFLAQGVNGATGAQGNVGPVGPMGPSGDTGSSSLSNSTLILIILGTLLGSITLAAVMAAFVAKKIVARDTPYHLLDPHEIQTK